MFDFNLSPRERVKKARIKLLREKPFFGYALMHVHLVSKKDPKPRGPKIVYSEDFVEQLDNEELQAVLAHELFHYLLGHTKRAKAARKKFRAEKDRAYHQRMNVAEDCVVNAILLENGFRLPRTRVVIEGSEVKVRQGAIVPVLDYSSRRLVIRLRDAEGKAYEIWDPEKKSAEEVYWEIRDFAVGDGDNSDTMYFSDDETDDDEGGESRKDGECRSSGKTESDRKNSAGGMRDNRTPGELMSEAYAYAKMQGKVPAGLDRLVTDALKPRVDWKAVLRRHLSRMVPHDYTFLKPSRKSPPNVILPGIAKAEHLEALVAVDTSGSISDEELAQFLAEIRWIARNFSINVTLVSCDAEIQTEEQVRSMHGLDKFKPKGGGGTDFRPVFELAARKKARLLIFFTDGYGTFPEKRPPFQVIWVVSERGAPESQFPFGRVVKMQG